MLTKRIVSALLLLLALCVSISSAAPYTNQPYDFYQPDGSKVTVLLTGDEFYMRAETTDGYTVVKDATTGWICYAQLSPDGNKLVSTGVPVGYETVTKDKDSGNTKSITPTIKVEKQIQINLDTQSNIVNETKNYLIGEDKTYVGEDAYISSGATKAGESAAAAAMPGTKNVNDFKGTIRGLVMIFDFSDAPATYTLQQYTDKVNRTDYYYTNGNARSLRTYYEDVSNSTFILNHYVYGIFRAPKTFAEYDAMNYAAGARELLSVGLNQMEADGFDFSQLSTNSDGTIKAMALMYTGNPAAWAEGMWYHAGGWSGFSADGVRSGSYCTDDAKSLSPGTLIHEHGHMVAKWPDTYSYVGGEPGTWGVMGGGYCDLPNPYFLYENGWLQGENIFSTPSTYTMNSADPYFSYFYYDPDQPTEFYIARPYTRGLLYCPDIPEEGMTIWRINTNGDNANYPDRDRHIELVHPNNNDSSKSNGVVFKAGGMLDEFTSATTPSSDWKFGAKSGQPSGMEMTDISGPGSQMTFTLGTPPTPVPYYKMNGNLYDASSSGFNATGYNFTTGATSSDVYDGLEYDLDRCILFDGIDDYVACPDTVDTGNEFSVSFWVKPDKLANMILLDKLPAGSSGAGWSIQLDDNGKIIFRIGSGQNHTDVATPYPVCEIGRWTNITCTFDEDKIATIYSDSELRMIKTGISQTTANAATRLQMAIASEVDTSNCFSGYLDDIGFYDQVLRPAHFKNIESLSFKPKKGAVVHLKLDETSGNIAVDSSGNGMDSGLENGLSFDNNSVAGKVNHALQFDGSDDYILVPSDNPIPINDGFTVSLWAYPTSVASWSRFIDFGNGSNADNIIFGRESNTNNLFFEVYVGSSTYKVTATNAIQLNTWQFFAATVDSDGRVSLYKNGQLIRTGTTNPVTTLYRKNQYIGRSNWSSDAYFRGRMDDIRVYNYNLSLSDISAIYRQERLGGPIPANGSKGISPEAILDFEPSANAVAHDIYFGSSYNSVVNASHDSEEYFGRKYKTQFNPPLLDAWCRYYWRVDEVMSNGAVETGSVWEFDTAGFLQREMWANLSSDNYVSSLLSSANYPDNPDLKELISTFELPANIAEAYGSRVTGMIVPQASGNYRFWIAGDDEVELWLSSDSQPENVSLIAYVHNASTSYRNFDQYSSQRSGQIYLEGHTHYYVMALHKEGVGGDHMTVAWQGPDSPTRSIISEFWLRPPYGNEWPVFDAIDIAHLETVENEAIDMQLPYNVFDADGDEVYINKISGEDWLIIGPDGSLAGTPKDAHVGNHQFTVEAIDNNGGSDIAKFELNVAGCYSGELGMSDLEGFTSEWLADGSNNSADLDNNDVVDLPDFAVLADSWLTNYVDGLVAYWKFDEAGGNTIKDSYNNYDGSLVNFTETSWTDGVSGNSLEFDGVDDYVEIEGFAGIGGSSPRTITAWIKADEDLNNTDRNLRVILSYGAGQVSAGKKWLIMIDQSSGEIALGIYGAKLLGGPHIEDGEWHHVACILPSGENNINQVKLYIDFVEVETNHAGLDAIINTASTENVVIGGMDSNANAGIQQVGYHFKGCIDEVKIYSRALSASEISEMANIN